MTQTFTPQPDQWDAFVRANKHAHVLQLSAWGQLKGAFGWRPLLIAVGDDDAQIHAGVQVLLRPLPARLGQMAYIGMGPLSRDDDNSTLWPAVHQALRAQGVRFLKWEPGVRPDETTPLVPQAVGFRHSVQTIQPPRTVLIDIRGDEADILARMNQGTRRKIRLGDKKGVRFFRGGRDDLSLFNTMMQATGTRNEFGVHDPAYYEMAFDLFAPAGEAALFLATHEDDALAGIMVFSVGQTAWYLYGASASVKRNLMASYGVQWRAIQWARGKGCHWYDMWGVPDEDEATLEAQFQDRSDGLWGVYGFKRGWGGQVKRSVGAWDHVYHPAIYLAYQAALKLRR